MRIEYCSVIMKIAQKLVRLVYNPTAGEGEHSKDTLMGLIKKKGYDCEYSSSKKKILKAVDPRTDLIAIAGGDGTIRKTIIRLLDKKLKFKRPLAILPYGTANNIATSLKIEPDPAKNIASWSSAQLRPFDVGQVIGLEKPEFFIESFGFGLFPKLMSELKKMDTSDNNGPEDEFKLALAKLYELVHHYKPVKCSIELDGKTIEEECLMVEVMNISSMGPKMKLNSSSDPGDGFFELIIVKERDRDKIAEYVRRKQHVENPAFPIKPIRIKQLVIKWAGEDVHIDDEVLIPGEHKVFKISVLENLLQILNSKTA